MMDPELKEQWVNALRSGRYEQGNSQLKIEDEDGSAKYCCLGVLCEIYPDGQWASGARLVEGQPVSVLYYSLEESTTWAYLPDTLREMSGIDNREELEVAKLNDYNRPFGEIADYIEKNL